MSGYGGDTYIDHTYAYRPGVKGDFKRHYTYDQHGGPHHLGDALPQLGGGAGLAQPPRKPPGLGVSRGGHRCAPALINDGGGTATITTTATTDKLYNTSTTRAGFKKEKKK